MSNNESYALWIMPAAETYDQLARVIFDLSQKYGTPVFEPHVTLLANIPKSQDDAAAHCQRLATILEPYSIQLTKLDQLDEYYRCLFVRVRETDAVVKAHWRACDIFGIPCGRLFMPHLSLLYGEFQKATKREIIANLGDSWNLEFYVDRFHLIDGRGGPTEWRKLGEFALPTVRSGSPSQ